MQAVFWLALVVLLWQARGEPQKWGRLTPYRARGVKGSGPATMAAVERVGDELVTTVFCAEPHMDKLVAEHRERDDPNVYADDSIEILVRTEAENHFHLITNSLGVVYDTYVTQVQTLDWDSHADVRVQRTGPATDVIAADGWRVTVRIPIKQLTSAASVSPWRINVCRNRRVPGTECRYYTLCGWYGQPEEWLEVDVLNGQTVDLEALLPGSVNIPEPSYDPSLLSGLHSDNRWIATQGLRLFTGWAMDTFRGRKSDGSHVVYRILDSVADAGFSAVVVGPTEQLGWIDSSYTLDCALSAAIHARLNGLRVIWGTGYLNAGMQGRIGTDVVSAVDRTGKSFPTTSSPLDARVWRDHCRDSVSRAIAWERAHGVRLGIGCYVDVEHQMGLEECYSDLCFAPFLEEQQIKAPGPIPPGERHRFLLDRGLVPAYQDYLKQRLLPILRSIRETIVEQSQQPGYLFVMYPGHVSGRTAWMGQAMALALGDARAPVVLMEDDTYFSGYTGSYSHLNRDRETLRKILGYEPLYLPAICYLIHIDRYPTWSPERVERELALLNRWGAGTIAYQCAAPGKETWEGNAPFFPVFQRVYRRLRQDGTISAEAQARPASPEREELLRLKAEIDARIRSHCARNKAK